MKGRSTSMEQLDDEQSDGDMVVSAHFSNAKRYSDVDSQLLTSLRAQHSFKAHRSSDSAHATPEQQPSGAGADMWRADDNKDSDTSAAANLLELDSEYSMGSAASASASPQRLASGLRIGGASEASRVLRPTVTGGAMQVVSLEDAGATAEGRRKHFLGKLRHAK